MYQKKLYSLLVILALEDIIGVNVGDGSSTLPYL